MGETEPDPGKALAAWARSNIRAMRQLMNWESHRPEAFWQFVLWTVQNPSQDLDAFLRSHGHDAMLGEILVERRGMVRPFMEWCRLYPAAAESLVSYVAPLEWIGDHLYRL